MPSGIPDDAFEFVVRSQNHPIAFTNEDGSFLWVNGAWEDLLGYSEAELRQKTWMEITVAEDVGGDLKSAKELAKGERRKYSMSKRYIAKSGDKVAVDMTVLRFPQHGSFEMFVAEIGPQYRHQLRAIKERNDHLQEQLEQSSRSLSKAMNEHGLRINELERIIVNNANTSKNDIRINSTPMWLGGVLIALIGASVYLAYISGWGLHGGDADPPRPSVVKPHEHPAD